MYVRIWEKRYRYDDVFLEICWNGGSIGSRQYEPQALSHY